VGVDQRQQRGQDLRPHGGLHGADPETIALATYQGVEAHFSDPNGVKTGHVDDDGHAAAIALNSATLTAGVPVGSYAELRAEVRHDQGTETYFHAGSQNSQTTGQLAALAWF
jgi:hypothetical protein